MPVVDIPFGEWLPSAPSFKNPGCVVADNVIPAAGGSYKPFPAPVVSAGADGPVKGAQQLFDNAGNSILVGGTATKLFTRRTSLAATSGYTAIPTGEYWDFARFNDFVIATGVGNSPQYLSDIDTDDTWSALPGTPPVAKRVAKVGEFLMLGCIANAPNRIQWSAFNNPGGTWGTDRLTQSGLADLDSQFGEVMRIVGGRYAIVFQERGIQRLSYVGPPLVWRADVIEQDRGCIAPMSVVPVGYLAFFLAQDGFYITDGSSVQPIGTCRVNRWFFDNVDQLRIGEVCGAIDWENEAVIWAFPSSNGVGLDRVMVFSWAQQRWSSATISVDCFVGSQVDGVSLEALDAIYGDLENIPGSLDDPEFAPGSRVLAAFIDGDYATFSGSPLEATWQTGEAQPSPTQRSFVSEVHPLIQATNWDTQISIAMRDNRGGQVFSPLKETGWSGFAPVRGEGQKVAIRMIKPAGSDWSEAQGVQVRYSGAGVR